MIEFVKVTKRFGHKLVLNAVDLCVPDGEIAFVIGKSGMGKSVLLKHIVGLMAPDSGEIRIDGESVIGLKEPQWLQIRKKCGMVFQHPALLDSLTVLDNVAFGLRAHGIGRNDAERAEKVKEMLSLVGLDTKILPRFPPELSFGIQKRVSIARALAVGPRHLLFDEPTTGLDPVATSAVNQLIFKLSRELRASAIVVSHDMHCALEVADRILLLEKGSIVAAGPPQDLVFSPDALAQEFLKEAKERRYGS